MCLKKPARARSSSHRTEEGHGAGSATRIRRHIGDRAFPLGAQQTSILSNRTAAIIAGIAKFERELTWECIRSGIAAATARGKCLGRQPGQRPKSDRLAPKVLALVAAGESYRLSGRELGLSKNTGHGNR